MEDHRSPMQRTTRNIYAVQASSIAELRRGDRVALQVIQRRELWPLTSMTSTQTTNTADALTADELLKELPNLVKALEDPNGVVSVGRLASEVRALSHPMLRESAPHDSNFKMPEDRVIEADAIEKAAASPSKDGE